MCLGFIEVSLLSALHLLWLIGHKLTAQFFFSLFLPVSFFFPFFFLCGHVMHNDRTEECLRGWISKQMAAIDPWCSFLLVGCNGPPIVFLIS